MTFSDGDTKIEIVMFSEGGTKLEIVPGIHRDVLNSETPLRNNFCLMTLMTEGKTLVGGGGRSPTGGHASD